MENNLDAMVAMSSEFYYWMTVVFIFLVHTGFCVYEMGAGRRANRGYTQSTTQIS